ncbi:MAG: HRDC domain-containing protein, partial [Proteobacteria bacterium]|nr:HRDC domain-containing protein [Pseudomonadota bacterium]
VAKGRADWVAEETTAYENPALYRTDPALAWRRLKGLNRLRPAEQSAARALADWRERRAIEADKPRGWILTDEALYALATREPVSIAALESVPALPPGVIRKRGDELLELLRAARADESGVPLSAPKRPEPAQMALATRLLQVVRDVAAELEVSAEMLATRKDVEAIAFGSGAPDASPLMHGWRRDVVG